MSELTAIFGPHGFNAEAVLVEARLQDTGVNAEIEFQRALEEYGLWVDGPIVPSGEVVRCAVRDKRHSSSKPGWYIWWGPVGTSDVHVGCYGDWRAGDTGEKWVSRDVEALSAEHRAKYEDAMARMRQAQAEERARQHEESAREAQQIFDEAGPASPGHPYLARKQVRAHGIKQSGSRLIIPCRNAAGQIRTLQIIDSNATKEKLLLKGGQKRGCFHLIGSRLESPAYVAEGYSTGATVHELTGRPVVVAIDAHNIGPVIQSLRESRYSGRLIVAADNDRFSAAGNTGVEAAESAAAADAAVSVVVPQFKGSAEGTDFNDLAALEGREVAEAQLRAALEDVDGADDNYQRNLAIASGRMKIEVTERDTRQAVPFPVQSLEELTRWICERTGAEYGVAPQMAALSVAALAASRRYRTPQGDGLHLNQVISAQSFAEAAPLIDAAAGVIRGAGLRRMLSEQRLTSGHAMIARLYRSPAMLYMPTDFGRRFFGPRYANIEELNADIGRNFSREQIPIDSPHEYGLRNSELNDGDQAVIHRPSFNLLAFTSEADLPNLFADQYMGRGLIETLLFCRESVSYPGEGRSEATAPEDAIARIRALRGLPDQDGDFDPAALFGEISELVPTMRVVDFTAAPASSRYADLAALSDDMRHRPLLQGSRGLLRRVAAVLAVFEQPESPVVTPAMLDWAAHLVAWSSKGIIQASHTGAGEDGKSSTYEKVLAYIGKAGPGGIKNRDLISRCKPFRNLGNEARLALLDQLIDDGEVVKHPSQRSTYILASLVETPAQEVRDEKC